MIMPQKAEMETPRHGPRQRTEFASALRSRIDRLNLLDKAVEAGTVNFVRASHYSLR